MRFEDKRSRSRSSRPCVELCEARTLLSAVVWTGGAGTDNWDTAANWSTDSLPGSADDVTIGAGATVVHSGSDSDSINSLTSSGTLSVTGGTLSIASASTVSTLTVGGLATLTCYEFLGTASGLLTLSGAILSGSGTIAAAGGIAINTLGSTLKGITLTNATGETAAMTGSSILNMFAEDGAVFNNDGTFLVQVGGSFSVEAGTAASAFNNNGPFIDSAPSVFTFGLGNSNHGPVNFNSDGGTVNVQDGTLELDGGGNATGSSFSVATGAELELSGTSSFDAASSIQGAGNVSFASDATASRHVERHLRRHGGTTAVDDGSFNYSGTTVVMNGPVDIDWGVCIAFDERGHAQLERRCRAASGFARIPTVQAGGTVSLGAHNLAATTPSVAGTLSGTGTDTVSGLLTLERHPLSKGTVDALGGMTIRTSKAFSPRRHHTHELRRRDGHVGRR